MKRDEVLAMKPGRELDALVAEKVMGWSWGIIGDLIPAYSTAIADAWEVEEEIEKQNKRVAYCQVLKTVLHSKDEYVGMFDYVHASPADRCKAALLAVMEGEKDD